MLIFPEYVQIKKDQPSQGVELLLLYRWFYLIPLGLIVPAQYETLDRLNLFPHWIRAVIAIVSLWVLIGSLIKLYDDGTNEIFVTPIATVFLCFFYLWFDSLPMGISIFFPKNAILLSFGIAWVAFFVDKYGPRLAKRLFKTNLSS